MPNLIADANGLRTDADLQIGQSLTIPNKISNLHNDYATHKVYAPGEIIGDTTPTLPEPPPPPPPQLHGKKGCGVIGQIIVIIVTIIVAWYTGYAIGGTTTTTVTGVTTTSISATGLVAGAVAGSIAGQLTGMALGIQDKFSWKQVASAALTAGFTGNVSIGSGSPVEILKAAGWGALNNAVGQGVNIVVGLQEKFDWHQVAAGAISAPINAYINQSLGIGENGRYNNGGVKTDGIPANKFDWGYLGRSITGEALKATVRQYTNIRTQGEGRMDWTQVAVDGFGNAIGNSVIAHEKWEQQQQREREKNAERELNRAASARRFDVQQQELETELELARETQRGYTQRTVSVVANDAAPAPRPLTPGSGTSLMSNAGFSYLPYLNVDSVAGNNAAPVASVPDQAWSDALYFERGPIGVARFNVGPASLMVNGSLNAVNSFGNAVLNVAGQVSGWLADHQGEITSIETGIPRGNIAVPPTVALLGGLRVFSNFMRAESAASELSFLSRGTAVANTISREGIVGNLGEVLQPHLKTITQFDADAMVGFRGSLARGFKGEHKGGAPFNVNDFDVDAFIVSDKLAAQYPKSIPFRNGGRVGEIGEAQASIDQSLRQLPEFSGLRNEPFTFRIYTQREIQRMQANQDAQYFFIKN